MSALLYRLGRLAARRPWRVVGAWVLAFVAIAAIGRALGGQTSDTFRIPGSETQRAADLLQARFPAQSGSAARVVFHTAAGTVDAEPAAAAIRTSLAALATNAHVVSVSDVLGADAARHVSADRTIAYAEVRYDEQARDLGRDAVTALETATQPAKDAGVQVEYGGEVVDANTREKPGSEYIGLLVAVVVLLFAFGSVIAMGLPLLTAVVGLGIGLSAITMLAGVLDLNSSGPILATMIGLGVGIDYALFIVTRHRQFLREGLTVAESVARANATSGTAVVFAGGTVVIAICGLQIAGLPMVTSMGLAASIVVAVMVLVSISLLPALLALIGRRIDRLTLPGMRARAEGDTGRSAAARWANLVARHPWRAAGASLAALVVLALPLFSIRLGVADAGSQPPSSTLRRSYDLLTEGFGPGFNGPLSVAVDLTGAAPDTLGRLRTTLAAEPGVAAVAEPVVNRAGDTAIVTVVAASKPQDRATTQLVHRLRDATVPGVVAQTGGRAYVSGPTAAFIDLSDRITQRLPWFMGAVIAMSFLLLMAVFRSVLVPLKAALMNLLAIGAAYGVVVAVFQWGWLGGLVGMEEPVPIMSFLPMMMFAILFGLSMDYEVFILSRVREEWVRTGDSRRSVVEGLTSTARVITSAAIIMISVFGAFLLGNNPIIKMFGLGMAVAVLVDATIVRMVLVPASMELMGRANWWLPAWLDRVLPRVDVEGEHGLPEPEREPDHRADAPTAAHAGDELVPVTLRAD